MPLQNTTLLSKEVILHQALTLLCLSWSLLISSSDSALGMPPFFPKQNEQGFLGIDIAGENLFQRKSRFISAPQISVCENLRYSPPASFYPYPDHL
jgi:hypothetical protein